MDPSRGSRRGIVLLFAASLLFGAMAVLVRAASGTLPVGEILLLRFLVAAPGAAIAARALRRSTGGHRRLLLLRGALGGIAVALYFYSLAHLPAATAALLNTSAPIFAIYFARVFLGERPPQGLWLGVAIAAAGTVLVVAGSAASAVGGAALGVAAGLLSALFSGGAIAAIRAARRHYNAGDVFLWFAGCGLVVSAPLAAGERWAVGAGVVLALGGAMAALFAQLVYTEALGEVETWIASAFGQATPIAAWAMGVVVLGERLSRVACAGALLTCAGVAYAAFLHRGLEARAAVGHAMTS